MTDKEALEKIIVGHESTIIELDEKYAALQQHADEMEKQIKMLPAPIKKQLLEAAINYEQFKKK